MIRSLTRTVSRNSTTQRDVTLAIDERNSSRPSGGSTPAVESDALREANKRIKLLEQENEVLRRAAAYLSQANLPGK
jgi:hypothetical protein